MIVLITLIGLTLAYDIPDLDYLDTSVDPCDNFYQYTCGNFKNVHPRPKDQEVLDLFTRTEDDLIRIGNEILASPKRDEDPVALKKVKAAYQSCVDVDYSDNIPIPELQLVDDFDGMPLISSNGKEVGLSWKQIGEIVGRTGVPQFFQFTVNQFDPERYILLMLSDGLDDPELFRPKTKTYDDILKESFKKTRGTRRMSSNPDPFDKFLHKIAKNLIQTRNPWKRDAEIDRDLDDIRVFMNHLSSGGIVDKTPLDLSTTPTLQQLQNWTDLQFGNEIDLNWVDYINGIFHYADMNVTDDFQLFTNGTESIYGILNLVRLTDPKVVKNFVLLRTFLFLAPDSDQPTRIAFEEYYKSSGLRYYDRWEYCTRKILDIVDPVGLSFAVTHNYQRYHYNMNKITKAFELINDIKGAFKDILDNSDWVDYESRDAVLQKIHNIMVSLAYPEFVHDKASLDDFYSNVRICEWDNYGNAQRIRAFKQAYALTKYKEKQRDFWGKSPFEVNAFYIRATNNIMVPIGILQPGFFRGDNPFIDYSRLGNIIAHEMTHGFDNGGIAYNETGFRTSWLSESTLENFQNRAQCFIDQYSQFYIEEIDTYLDGGISLNENIADNGGIRKAFLAFRKYVTEQKVPNPSSNYTMDQLFFITYGTYGCSQESDNYLTSLVENDLHPPSRLRIIGALANFDEFAKAFNCPIGSPMNPAKKCVLW